MWYCAGMEPESIVIEVRKETAKELRSLAERKGVSIDELLRAYVPELAKNDQSKTQATKVNSFIEWASNHRTDIPPLSEEAVSRESFYEE